MFQTHYSWENDTLKTLFGENLRNYDFVRVTLNSPVFFLDLFPKEDEDGFVDWQRLLVAGLRDVMSLCIAHPEVEEFKIAAFIPPDDNDCSASLVTEIFICKDEFDQRAFLCKLKNGEVLWDKLTNVPPENVEKAELLYSNGQWTKLASEITLRRRHDS